MYVHRIVRCLPDSSQNSSGNWLSGLETAICVCVCVPLKEVQLLSECELSKQQDCVKHRYTCKQLKQLTKGRPTSWKIFKSYKRSIFLWKSNRCFCVWCLFPRRDEFNIKVLQAFVELHEFADLNLVQALRWENCSFPPKNAWIDYIYIYLNLLYTKKRFIHYVSKVNLMFQSKSEIRNGKLIFNSCLLH